MGLFEFIYYLGYRVKTFYDLSRQSRLPERVVCVGNLTTGGTGKTPATVALAGEALGRGLRPCILTRGYHGRAKGPLFVSPHMKAGDVGDEPLMMASRLPGVPVVKDGDRFRGGMFAMENMKPSPDIFILDDGFQHRKLHRDLDILLINSNAPFDNRKLLPMGQLREPLSQMKRADIIVLTKCETGQDNGELIDIIRKYNADCPIFEAWHVPSGVFITDGKKVPVSALKGREVCAFSGIADADSFRETLEGAGAKVVHFAEFADHYNYTSSDVGEIEKAAGRCSANWIITTEKDIMRLKEAATYLPLDLVYLGIEFRISEEFYDLVFNKRR